jgi:hypothetical protein
MTKRNVSDDLYDPRNGDPAIRTLRLDLGRNGGCGRVAQAEAGGFTPVP